MKIVINIPEELYKKISLNNPTYGEDFPLYYAVRNCTKLPKGHGRLIDADELKKHKYHDYDRFDNAVSVAQIDWATTIIEADKKGESGISLCDTCSNCECIFQTGVVREQCEFYIEEVEEIDFVAEHQKADMSKVDRIIINKKVYLSADKIMEIMTEAEKHDQYFRYAYGEIEKLKGVKKE